MKPAIYLSLSERTEKKFPDGMTLSPLQMELLHHVMGVVTEAGELMDAMKRHLIYGKELDLTNVKEEVGDVLWYLAGVLRLAGSDFPSEMSRNIAKLMVRFPNRFESDKALVRDLDSERQALEKQNVDQFTSVEAVLALREDAMFALEDAVGEYSDLQAALAYVLALERTVSTLGSRDDGGMRYWLHHPSQAIFIKMNHEGEPADCEELTRDQYLALVMEESLI